MLIVCVFIFYIIYKGGNSKLYCFIFEKEDWGAWETIVKNFDYAVFREHNAYEDRPNLEAYLFDIITPNGNCQLIYWVNSGDVSVHDYPVVGCLSSFNKYHQKVVKGLLCEKFDFMKEVIGQ